MLNTSKRYPTRNYVLNTLEGVLAATGQAMIGINVLMLFISEYIDNKTLIGLLVTINILLMHCGQIFLSGRVQNMPYLKSTVVILCFVERTVWIVLGIGVIVLSERDTGLFLALFYIMYAAMGLGTAFVSLTWTTFIVRITHPAVRGRFLGIRSAITGIFSMLGALAYGFIISRWKLPLNYGLLFIIAGASQIIALPLMGGTREPAFEDVQTDRTGKTRINPVTAFEILRKDSTFACYILAMALIGGFGKMAFSFQVVFAKEKLFISEENNSYALFLMLACQCAGALLCGMIGDKYGFKKLMTCAMALLLPALLITYFMNDFLMFYISMGLVGLVQGLSGVCTMNLLIWLSKGLKNMPAYAGIQNFALGPVYALNYIISGALYDAFGYGLICVISALSLILGVFFLYRCLWRKSDANEDPLSV